MSLPNLVRVDAERDGTPVVVWVNAALLGLSPRDAWPWHVAVTLVGPDPLDAAAREALEDEAADIASELLDFSDVLLVGRVTGRDRVELLLRAHDDRHVRSRLAELSGAGRTSRVDEDPTWSLAAPALHLLAER